MNGGLIMRRRWLGALGLTSLILCIVSLAILITINFRPLYVFDIGHLNILDYTTLSEKELLKNFDLLMRYLNTPWITELKLPDFPMSTSGAFHFYEVKRLFLLDYVVFAVTLIPAGLYLRYLKNHGFWRVIRPMQWAMLLPVLFGFLMMIGFDQFFVAFHGLFFNNDAWLFNPATDPIINVLPEQFFMHCFILFFVLIEGFFFFFYWLGRRDLKIKK